MTKLRFHRRALLGLGLIILLPAAWPVRAATTDASAPIRALNAALLAIMQAGKSASFAARFDMLAPAVDRAFDLETILHGVIGPRWAGLAAAEQAALRTEFRRFTVATWVANFDSFNGESINVKPQPRALDGGALVVETAITAPGADPVELSYVMRAEGDAWRAVDILAQGTISRVAVLRSDFRRTLAEGGAAALLARLRAKVDALSNGQTG